MSKTCSDCSQEVQHVQGCDMECCECPQSVELCPLHASGERVMALLREIFIAHNLEWSSETGDCNCSVHQTVRKFLATLDSTGKEG